LTPASFDWPNGLLRDLDVRMKAGLCAGKGGGKGGRGTISADTSEHRPIIHTLKKRWWEGGRGLCGGFKMAESGISGTEQVEVP